MRNIKSINNDWSFTKKGETVNVNLPHTWNGVDGQDGGNDYYRGVCRYEKKLTKTDIPEGDKVYIQFDGVNSSAIVYLNGRKLAEHKGGYSTFRAELDGVSENDIIAVDVDNSPNDEVYPQVADFTFYGGIYRDVSLIGVNKKHFDLDYYGAPGIMVTPEVDNGTANVTVQAFCEGDVEFEITDDGVSISKTTVNGKNPAGVFSVDNPHLWDGMADPHLYKAYARLFDDNGKVVDEIYADFGIRSFEINPDKGFILNGREYPLRGVSRHQDRPDIGNALLPAHHLEDIELICEMGANTVRLAHYQHSQYFYDLCDRRGLVVWAEIPYISKHMPDGVENTKQQMTELICQNYNHPSIVVWGISNEITMSGAGDLSLVENHRMLNDLCHSLDKTRPTTLASVTMCGIDEKVNHISDVLSYNHYFGWYGGNTSMYGPWFDDFHKKYPDKSIGISEYGCEALNWHTSEPAQGDYTEEYQSYYHEELIKQIAVRPYLWATHVWNMFDFAADARSEGGENGMNHKGLVTFDRRYKKDAFYAYKSWLSDEPVLHICSKRYVNRTEAVTKVTVYSNQEEVELFANGISVGKQKKGDFPFFYFEVENKGKTLITAKAGELCDESEINKVDTPDESYIMKEEGAVINWFEINTPAGRYSVNDTIGDIMKTASGKAMLLLILFRFILPALKRGSNNGEKKEKKKKADVMGMTISKTMIELAKGFTVKRAFMMLGGKFTKEEILSVNKLLNKVKKV